MSDQRATHTRYALPMNTLARLALVVAFALPPAVHAAADDTPVNLLKRLEAAVLAGDADAYLANIDTTVPEWATEQANWAADLAEHTPVVFDLLVIQNPRLLPSAEEGPMSIVRDLRITWRLPDAREREVEFPARFTEDEHQNWFYAGEAWHTTASDDGQNIVLFLDPDLEEIADRIIDIMPGIREHVDEGFETSLNQPQVIKLYTDMQHLQESIYLSYEDPLGGWNEPGEAIKIMASPRSGKRQLQNLLAHEYGHVATFTYDPNATDNIPWWAAEGVAELASERYAGTRAKKAVTEAVRAWAEAGTLADWNDMADFRKTPASLHGHVYLQGHEFVGYISERFGRTARNHWLRLLATGSTTDEASTEAFHIGFDLLDRQWRDSLQSEADE